MNIGTDHGDPLHSVRTVVNTLYDAVGPCYVAILEIIPGTSILRPIVERGVVEVDVDNVRAGMSTLSVDVLSKGETRKLLDSSADLDSVACRRIGVEAMLIVPLRHNGDALGAIHLAWNALDDASTLEQAEILALDLQHWVTPDLAVTRVAGEIERGYVAAIASVSATLNERNRHTSGHGQRVAKIALEIAELIHLSEHEQRQLVYAAEMHDLGQVAIPDDVLGKPGALTDDEWNQVKTIPLLGAEIVEPVSFFGDVRDAILHLHERWDGEGYPAGIAGSDIPLLSRVLAVAEAYDSMTSSRPYRDAMSPTDALRQLWAERGKAFDPDLVETFVVNRSTGRIASA